jgi:hypothetical protein
LIFGHGFLSTLALHDCVEDSVIRALESFQEKRGGVHRGQLLCDGGCNKLVEAGAVGLGASYDLRFHRGWQAKGIGASGFAQVSRDNQGGKRDNQDGKFFEGAIVESFGSDLTRLEAI